MGNDKHLPFAWSRYKDDTEDGREQAANFKETFSRSVQISFIGVWDTVASVSLYGRHYSFTRSNPSIQVLRHAVALDERRVGFQPNLCNNGLSSKDIRNFGPSSGYTMESLAQARLPDEDEIQDDFSDSEVPQEAGPHGSSGSLAPPTNTNTPSNAARPAGILKPSTGAQIKVRDMAYDQDEATEHQPGNDQEKEIVETNDAHNVGVRFDDELSPKNSYKEMWFAGCHSDVGGGTIGGSNGGPNLANVSLGWMVREAIEADVGLLFRPKAFEIYLGVLALVGPTNCARAGLRLPHDMKNRVLDAVTAANPQITPPEMPNRYVYDAWKNWEPTVKGKIKIQEAGVDTTLATLMEAAFVEDARAGIRDPPKISRGWWILEYWPLRERRVRHDGYMRKSWMWNRGKGRDVLTKMILIHFSVQARESYKPQASWKVTVKEQYLEH